MKEKAMRTAGPATQPSWAMAHARDSTPDPITAVMICALAVIHVPSQVHKPKSFGRVSEFKSYKQEYKYIFRIKKSDEILSSNLINNSVAFLPVLLGRPSSSRFLRKSPFSTIPGLCSMYMLLFWNCPVISFALSLSLFWFFSEFGFRQLERYGTSPLKKGLVLGVIERDG